MPRQTFVIAGAGTCGASAAQTLRAQGFDGRLVLLGDEPDEPYERPPLSKDYLMGAQERDALLVRPRGWYESNGIELRTGTPVTAIDPAGRQVLLAGGERIPFTALLLATGGRPRLLPSGHGCVRYLRSLADAARLRGELRRARHVVIAGAGFIGAECAAAARALGAEVTMIEVLDVPLSRGLGRQIGALYAAIHRDEGVRLRTGQAVAAVGEAGDGTLRVRTTTHDMIECDLVIAGIGMRPAAGLAEEAGLATADGVVVDEYCRTSAPGVYAAGDVARHFHPLAGEHVRVEHHDHALRHGAAAARSMLGGQQPYADCHWFWSDQYGYNLQYAGYCPRWDQMVIRGSLAARAFTAFYLSGGVLRAALAVNRPADIVRARKLIAAQAAVPAAVLADEDADLRAHPPATA